jgi:hypothetical protein
MRDGQPSVRRVYGVALRRVLTLIGAGLLLVLGMVGLGTLATVLFALTLFGVLGSLIALVGLMVWATRPTARTNWLKWLIVLTAPFGLPVFVFVRWSLLVPAAVLEGRGPLGSLQRSNALVRGHWFYAAAVLSVAGLIVTVLVSAPGYVLSLPLSVAASARGNFGPDPIPSVVGQAVSLICQVLFASIGSIACTLLFTELRNRREGADLAERVRQLKQDPVSE